VASEKEKTSFVRGVEAPAESLLGHDLGERQKNLRQENMASREEKAGGFKTIAGVLAGAGTRVDDSVPG